MLDIKACHPAKWQTSQSELPDGLVSQMENDTVMCKIPAVHGVNQVLHTARCEDI